MRLTAVALTNSGKVRDKNEDNFYFNGEYLSENNPDMKESVTMKIKTGKPVLMAVFDGVGGACYGEKASYVSAEEMAHFFDEKKEIVDSTEFFREICHRMNERVCGLEDFYLASMGCTVSALLFEGKSVTICNLGDSPVFRVRKEKTERIHQEHTNRRLLEEQGIGRKPELTQCLGIAEEEMLICPYVRQYRVQSGDYYLLCSDGLTDMLSDEEISEIVRGRMTAEEKIKGLMENALKRGGRDNITIILIKAEN